MKMVLENERLPSIVEEFLSHSDTLRIHVEKATAEIVGDIRAMLYDHESKFSYALKDKGKYVVYILTRP